MAPGNYKPVYKSEFTESKGGNLKWNAFMIDTSILCNSDPELELKIEVYV